MSTQDSMMKFVNAVVLAIDGNYGMMDIPRQTDFSIRSKDATMIEYLLTVQYIMPVPEGIATSLLRLLIQQEDNWAIWDGRCIMTFEKGYHQMLVLPEMSMDLNSGEMYDFEQSK